MSLFSWQSSPTFTQFLEYYPFFSAINLTVFTLYILNELKFTPATLGLILGVGSIGPVLGALLAGRFANKFGLGRTIIFAKLTGDLFSLLTPLATGSSFVVIGIIILAQFVGGLCTPVYVINIASVRQTIVPHNLQGRISASARFITFGTVPLGALAGGVLGNNIGLRATLFVGSVGLICSFLWVFFSKVRYLAQLSQIEPL